MCRRWANAPHWESAREFEFFGDILVEFEFIINFKKKLGFFRFFFRKKPFFQDSTSPMWAQVQDFLLERAGNVQKAVQIEVWMRTHKIQNYFLKNFKKFFFSIKSFPINISTNFSFYAQFKRKRLPTRPCSGHFEKFGSHHESKSLKAHRVKYRANRSCWGLFWSSRWAE